MAKRTLLVVLGGAALTLIAMPVGTASAGKLVATGHDVDGHCDSSGGGGQCHFQEIAVGHVRSGAPDPSKPVLALDCSGDLDDSLTGIGVPHDARCPSVPGDGFASLALTTDAYSAIVVGSSCGDSINLSGNCGNPAGPLPDTDAILARKPDIEAFFNAGGGVYAISGENNGDGDPSSGLDTYYAFLPLPVGGTAVTPPFTLTPEGIALGFEDASGGIGTNEDINCCPTHNSFEEPTNPLVKVAERDEAGIPETLFAEGLIIGGQIVSAAPPAAAAAPAPAKAQSKPTAKSSIRGPRGCVRSSATIRVRGQNIASVTYSLNGKRLKRATGNSTSVKVSASKLKRGKVNRVTARVAYTAATAAKSQTKRFSLARCARRAAQPKFTG